MGTSRPPRPPIAKPASWGHEPQPGLALLRLAQGKTRRLEAAIAAGCRRDERPPPAVEGAPRLCRDHACGRRSSRAARDGRRRARRDRPRLRHASAARSRGPRPRAPSCSPRAKPGAHWAPCDAPGSVARTRCRRTRPHGRACSSRSAAGRWATRTPRRWSSTRPGRVFAELGAAADLAAVEHLTREQTDAAGARADPAGAAGAPAAGDRQDQPRHRRRPGPRREDGGPARDQHLHQARSSPPARRPRRTRTSTGSSSGHCGNTPSPHRRGLGWFSRSAARAGPSVVPNIPWAAERAHPSEGMR